MSAHEIMIRFRHPFEIRGDGRWLGEVREITVPFADSASAAAAAREITVEVRPVHDAGGEDYRPVVSGEVVREPCELEAGRGDRERP